MFFPLETENPLVIGAGPERAVFVFKTGPDPQVFGNAGEKGFRRSVAHPIEPHQSGLRAQPEEAVVSLPDIVDCASGQTLLDGPDAMRVLSERPAGIQRQKRSGGANQENRD